MIQLRILLAFLLAFQPLFAFGQQATDRVVEGTQTPGFFSTRNYIKNPGAEKNVANVTASGGSLTRSTSSPLEGAASFLIDASATSQTFDWSMDTNAQLDGLNCEARFLLNGDASLYTVNIRQSGNDITAASALPNTASKSQWVSVNYPCGSSAATLRITSTADAAAIKVDSVYSGIATNLSNISQATLYGTATWAGTTNCQWSQTASTTFANFSADSDCPTPTVTGSVEAPTTKIPGVRLRNLPPGNYLLVAQGGFYGATAARGFIKRFSDGTNTTSPSESYSVNTDVIVDDFQGVLSYSSAQSDITVQVQAATDQTTATVSIINNIAWRGLQIQVYRFPTTSEIAVRPDVAAWRVDANISGAGSNPSLGTASVSSYTELTNASLTLTQNSGSAQVGIPCASGTTNTAGATTCASANESLGINFDIPRAGAYKVCSYFQWNSNTSASAGAYGEAIFQLVETTAASSAIVQEGKTKQSAQNQVVVGAAQSLVFPFTNCATFNFSSAGNKTVRLQYEQNVGNGGVGSSVVVADGSGTSGQRDVRFTVEPIDQAIPAPLLVGPFAQTRTVTSNTTLTGSDEQVFVNATSGAITITLPAANVGAGKKITVTKIDTSANAVTVQRAGSDVIGNALTSVKLLVLDEASSWVSDGSSKWRWASETYRTTSIYAGVCSSGTCATNNTGTLSYVSPGVFTLTHATGAFSGTAYCNCTSNEQSSSTQICANNNSESSSSAQFRVTTHGNSLSNGPLRVVCHGPR